MTKIVKGLWGDYSLTNRGVKAPIAFQNLLRSIDDARKPTDRIDAVYCYGIDNFYWLMERGFDPILLDNEPWASPILEKKVHWRFKWNGAIREGYSYWWHKFKIVEDALERFQDGVLWIDFDVRQEQENIDWLLSDLDQGREFRASLYVQNNWTWASGWRHKWKLDGRTKISEGDSHAAARLVCGCGFFYVRDVDIVREWLSLQDQYPHFLDHQIISLWFDLNYGEGQWIGADKYVAEGFHTKGYQYGRQMLQCDDVAFVSGA